MASSEQRVGTMAGAFLLRTVNVVDVRAVLDEYQQYFPTHLHRRHAFEAIMSIDRVATEIRSQQEEAERKRQEAAAESKVKR